MTEVDQIRQQMAQIRLNLHHDVSGVVAGAGSVFDLRKYIAKAPWVVIGLAFVAGYWVVPKKKKNEEGDGRLDKRPVIQIAPRIAHPLHENKAKPSSAVGAVLGFAWPIAARLAQSYAFNFVQNLLMQPESGPRETEGQTSGWGPPSAAPGTRVRGPAQQQHQSGWGS